MLNCSYMTKRGDREVMKYKALALDLDGTLTNREKKVPAGNKEAIAKAIDAALRLFLLQEDRFLE